MADESLEQALVEAKLITVDQLAVVKESQKTLGGSLEQILIDRGFATEEQILKALAKKMNTTFVSLTKYKVDTNLVKLIPPSFAKKHRIVPLFRVENKITVATSNPMDLAGLDDAKSLLNCEVSAVLALDSDIEFAVNEYYRGEELTEESLDSIVTVIDAGDEKSDEELTADEIQEVVTGEKVVRTVSNIITEAYKERASDIHIEPKRSGVEVRLRVDGILQELSTLPKAMHLPVISRIKIMGNMDVAERRLPQDGRVRVKVSGKKEIDMRIATYPTMFGEAAAVRLLTGDQVITLEELGFLGKDLDIFKSIITKPHGILLVTGPTGSGKTTTLYASLMQINSADQHILSIEDPIEHEIPGVDQQQVNLKTGMTFASALRSMLRQDPDIIMVGEIRDQETADIAIRAAMTGHLVFSTLHTNNAVGAISRLVDLGVEAYLIASTLVGVMAQRLVRKICPKCVTEISVKPEDVAKLGPTAVGLTKSSKGTGCRFCRKTGYKGRIGLFEILQVDDEMRVFINKNMPEVRIQEKAKSLGFHTILDDGVEKIRSGMTTVEEVLRVTAET